MSARLVEILKAHQLGFTWIFVAAYTLWCSITKPLHQVIINSFNEDAGAEIVKRIVFIRDRLPEWLYPPLGTDNNLIQEYQHRDKKGILVPSTIQVIPATEKGGQSKTPNILIFDESCWNRYVDKAYNSSLPGITQAKGKIIIISNAIKSAPGWPFTRSVYVGSMNGQNEFNRIFLPWWANPERSREPVQGMVDGKGQPMTLFKWQMLRSGGTNGGMMTEEDFEQRYPETEAEAISTLGGSYFGTTLKRHQNTRKGVVGTLKREEGGIVFNADPRGMLEVWRFPYSLVAGWDNTHWCRRYAIGSDVSEGLGQSYSVAYVMDRQHDEMVARLRSNRIDAYSWAEQLAMLGEWYSGANEWSRVGGVKQQKALICVERTGAGQTTVRRLIELNATQYLREIQGQQGGGHTKEYGWSETQQAKQDLSEDLRTWFRQMKGQLYDAILIDECSTWIKHEGTLKLGPEEGHYGDCVIAAGCAIQASHFLGASPERVNAPDTGWMAKILEKKGERTGWTV